MVSSTINHVLHFDMFLVAQSGFEMIASRVVIAALGPLERQRELAADRL